MKRVLYGTTALLAAGFIAGPAMAGSPLAAGAVDLVLDGEAQFDINYTSAMPGADPANDYRNINTVLSWALEFEMKAALDNGWSIGSEIQIELTEGSRDLETDQAFLWMTGAFGKIWLGGADAVEHDGAVPRTYDDVGVFGIDIDDVGGDVNDAHASEQVAAIDDDIEISGDQSKIIWEVPSIGGFSLAINYTPDLDTTFQNNPARSDDGGNGPDMLIAGAYSADMGGMSVELQLAYGTTTAEPADADVGDVDVEDDTRYRLGLVLGSGGIEVGAYWLTLKSDASSAALSAEDNTNWGIGATYGVGQWEFGAAWETATREQITAGTTTKLGDNESTRWDVGVDYAFRDDMNFVLGYRDEDYSTYNNDQGGEDDPGEQNTRSIDAWVLWDVGPGLEIDFGYQNFRYTHYTGIAPETRTVHGVKVVTELSF